MHIAIFILSCDPSETQELPLGAPPSAGLADSGPEVGTRRTLAVKL